MPRAYWYDTIKASNHDQLTEFINKAADEGWEPVQCWASAMAGRGNSLIGGIDHFCLLRMPVGVANGEALGAVQAQ